MTPHPLPLTRCGFARELLVAHGGVVDKGGHDDRGLLHVFRLNAIEDVLVRVVLRHADRTLRREDANALRERIYTALHRGAPGG